MGGAHSREELDTSDDEEYESGSSQLEDERYGDSKDDADDEERKSSGRKVKKSNSTEEVEAKLRDLKLKYGGQQQQQPEVVKNYADGVQGKGVYVNFDNGSYKRGDCNLAHATPKKALLMRAEANMLLMSPMTEAKPHSKGLHQLDIETGRIVTEWRSEKDGTDITMRDITNDRKGAQLDPSGTTFLGLDDDRLCRWDMRDKRGIVQDLISSSAPVLNWTQGHQFSRGTNFQCFVTTGDGSIVVGSLDGKLGLYSNSSMRQAKTAFPCPGSPITHVDVTFDGKWILGTTDTYLILICTTFADKDGNIKTGFCW